MSYLNQKIISQDTKECEISLSLSLNSFFCSSLISWKASCRISYRRGEIFFKRLFLVNLVQIVVVIAISAFHYQREIFRLHIHKKRLQKKKEPKKGNTHKREKRQSLRSIAALTANISLLVSVTF